MRRRSKSGRRVGWAGRAAVGRAVAGPWSPYGDSLGTRGRGIEKYKFLNQFLAVLGPFWAINPPSGGHGWPRLIFPRRFGSTDLHFGAKNAILWTFSWIFTGPFSEKSRMTSIWIQGEPLSVHLE